MFSQSLYSAESKIDSHTLFPVQILSESQLIQQILYMLLGHASQNIFHLEGKIGCQRWIKEHSKLSSLGPISVDSCVDQWIQFANQIMHIEEQAKRLYKWSYPMICAFIQGVYAFLQKYKSKITDLLTMLQKNQSIIPFSIALESTENQINKSKQIKNPLTLLSLSSHLSRFIQFNHLLLAIFSLHTQQGKPKEQDRLVKQILELWSYEGEKEYLMGASDQIRITDIFSRMICRYGWQIRQVVKGIRETIIFGYPNLEIKSPIENQEGQNVEIRSISPFQLLLNLPQSKIAVPSFLKLFSSKFLELTLSIAYTKMFFNQNEQLALDEYFNIDQIFFKAWNHLSFEKDLIQNKPTHEKSKQTLMTVKNKKKPWSTVSSRINHPQTLLTRLYPSPPPASNPYNIHLSVIGAFTIETPYPQKVQKPKLSNLSTSLLNQLEKCDMPPSQHLASIFSSILSALQAKSLPFFTQNSKIDKISKVDRIRINIRNAMQGIKKFMLWEQGDFGRQIMVLMASVWDKPWQKVSRHFIQNCMEEAIKCSNARKIPQQILSKLTFTALPASSMSGTSSVQLSSRTSSVFAFLYQPSHPISLLFPFSIMNNFSKICNFILRVKRCEFILTELWRSWNQIQKQEQFKEEREFFDEKQSRSMFQSKIKHARMSKLGYKVMGVRNRISYYVQSLMSFISIGIEVQWSRYQTQIDSSTSFLQILHSTQTCINNLLQLTLQNALLLASLGLLNELIDKFAKVSQKCILLQQTKFDNKSKRQFQEQKILKELQKMDNECKSIVQAGGIAKWES